MRQRSWSGDERRREPRQPRAFAFWVRPLGQRRRISAWMLDMAPGGAAFLTAADEAPRIGQRVALVEMATADRLVREDAAPLPRRARVLRHDEGAGVTRRVAVRFEADARAPRRSARRGTVAAARSAPAAVPPGPGPLAAPPPDRAACLARRSL